MTIITCTVEFETSGNGQILDVTNDIAKEIDGCGMHNGTVTIFSPSATTALTTLEYESGCIADFQRLFDEIADPTRSYDHNARWGDGNGHSHVRAALLGPSLVVPFVNGNLTLGTWQTIVFVDFDNRSRSRRLILQIIGE
jgi:secondary thiamine-phosphate synthase enzyme